MSEIFVDSSVFLRFYADDEAGEGKAAEELFFRCVRKEAELVTGPPVFFEVAWALKAWAKWPNSRIIDTLQAMSAIPNLRLTDKDTVVAALALAKETGQDFAGAYAAACAKARGAQVATFSGKGFARAGVGLYPMGEA